MNERGDIILDGLLRTIIGLLVFALIVFEIGAVVVNIVQVDGAAQQAARAAATEIDAGQSEHRVELAAEEAAATIEGGVVHDIDVGRDEVRVTVGRAAPVLVVDRIPPLRDRLVATTTATAGHGN